MYEAGKDTVMGLYQLAMHPAVAISINHITLKCVFYVFCYDLISIDWM
jgi:hypothetical protein